MFLPTVLSAKAFDWVVISSGTFGGSGLDKDRNKAHDECREDMEQEFIRLAQECCDSTENDTSARFGNRCAGDYSGTENNRSFSGGPAAYFCYPGYSEEKLDTGDWSFVADERDWECQELVDLPDDEPVDTSSDEDIETPADPSADIGAQGSSQDYTNSAAN